MYMSCHVPIIEVATSEIGDLIRCEGLLEIKTNLKYKFNVTKLVRSLMSATVHALAGKGPFAF